VHGNYKKKTLPTLSVQFQGHTPFVQGMILIFFFNSFPVLSRYARLQCQSVFASAVTQCLDNTNNAKAGLKKAILGD